VRRCVVNGIVTLSIVDGDGKGGGTDRRSRNLIRWRQRVWYGGVEGRILLGSSWLVSGLAWLEKFGKHCMTRLGNMMA
jgi:hypothetical protein